MRLSSAQRLGLSLGAAALLVVLLFAFGGVPPAGVVRALCALAPQAYLAALGLHVLTYLLRALRFQLLLPHGARPRFFQALAIAAAHNMASYVLPFKSGEAALIVYLKLQSGTPASLALAALLVSRFLDGAALCSGLALACFALHEQSGAPPQWLVPASLSLVVLTLVFLSLSLRGDLLVRALERGLYWLRVNRLRLGQRLLENTNSLALALRVASSRRRLGAAALATLPMWFTVFGFYSLLAAALGLAELSFLDRVFGASLATLCNLLPLNAAAGVGTQELGWVTGFHVVLGVDHELALTSGAGVHCVQLFNIVLLGLIAHLFLGFPPRWRFRRVE